MLNLSLHYLVNCVARLRLTVANGPVFLCHAVFASAEEVACRHRYKTDYFNCGRILGVMSLGTVLKQVFTCNVGAYLSREFLSCSVTLQMEISSLSFCKLFTADWILCTVIYHHHTTTVLRPFFRDHPGEPVPENFWTLWCKARLTEANTPTIRLSATPSGLTSAHLHHPPIFLQARCPSCCPANSIKALEAFIHCNIM